MQAIGWSSSLVLVLTIGRQVYKQWHDGTSRGVSEWLFLGQMAASSGFVIYSWLVDDYVFIVTNALVLVSAVVGCTIMRHHRRSDRSTVHAQMATRPRRRAAGRGTARRRVDRFVPAQKH